jgi:hypothetical protein
LGCQDEGIEKIDEGESAESYLVLLEDIMPELQHANIGE